VGGVLERRAQALSTEHGASTVDYDVYDSGAPSGDGSRGGYFQRLGVSRTGAEQWSAVREAVVAGRLDEAPATREHELTIGVLRRHGALWLYRFRLGLRDSFGRSGRIICVLVRCSGSGPVDVPLVSRLLAAADELHGCPVQLAPLDLVATWAGVGSDTSGRIASWLTASNADMSRLPEGEHSGYHLGAAGGVAHVTPLARPYTWTSTPPSAPPPAPRPPTPQTTPAVWPVRPTPAPPPRPRLSQPPIPHPTARWRRIAIIVVALAVLVFSRLDSAKVGGNSSGNPVEHWVIKLWRKESGDLRESGTDKHPQTRHSSPRTSRGPDEASRADPEDPRASPEGEEQ
jgi:hypothetical protein